MNSRLNRVEGVDKMNAPAIEVRTKVSGSRDMNERIPAHVWNVIQASGSKAASKLHDLLHSKRFDALSIKDQAALINLALVRAYGQPDAPLKREVKVKLSNQGADAVSAALERMTGHITLPENTHAANGKGAVVPTPSIHDPSPPNDD